MRIPRRFIVALPLGFLIGILLSLVFLYSQVGVPTEMSHWLFDVSQKKELLASKISGPRLLVVAGSSALFGINAHEIEQQTGFPTFNLGTHAGLYIDYILQRAKKVARPGDTILLAWEYELYSKKWADQTYDDYIVARDSEYFYQRPFLEKFDMALRIPFQRPKEDANNHEPPKAVGPYTPFFPGHCSINDNGDEMYNLTATRPALKPEMRLPSKTLKDGILSEQAEGFKILDAFIKWAQTNHITVLATFPSTVYQPDYDGINGQQTIQTITHFYQTHNVPVIGTAREAMLPLDDFYDTKYHLTHEAAIKRTDRLIPELRPYLHLPK